MYLIIKMGRIMIKMPRKKISRYKIILIIVVLVVLALFLFKPSFARYIYNGIKNYYYESQNFYFNCNKLSENGSLLQLDNWDGVNSFPIEFELNSFKNNSVAASSSIAYDITDHDCISTANVTCTITKEEGLIPTSTHTDLFTIRVTPNENLSQGDSVRVEVTVKSTSPYEKELSGVVILNVGVPGISYEIVDKVNQPYLDFNITNTLNYFRVVTPFGDYTAGARIEEAVYNTLSAADKEKCTSALIRLTFDPNVILVDVTSDFYDNAYSYTTQTINNKAYINGITFGVDRVSSISIRFYKANTANNYTYPSSGNTTPVITFEAL